jgi:hypothetical protein
VAFAALTFELFRGAHDMTTLTRSDTKGWRVASTFKPPIPKPLSPVRCR